MDHIFRGQVVGTRDPCFTSRASAQALALFFQTGTGCRVNSTADTPASQEAGVGGIDDSLGLKGRDVAKHDLDMSRHEFLLRRGVE